LATISSPIITSPSDDWRHTRDPRLEPAASPGLSVSSLRVRRQYPARAAQAHPGDPPLLRLLHLEGRRSVLAHALHPIARDRDATERAEDVSPDRVEVLLWNPEPEAFVHLGY